MSPSASIGWRFVADRVARMSVPILFGAALLGKLRWFLDHPETLFGDARLYFRATQAWLAGGDPWSAHDDFGVLFAAPPPALLLSLPIQPFGETAAVAFWVIAGMLGMAAAIRHYNLPWWWIAFPPFIEGLLPASPDPALLGALVLGGGAVAAYVKWYAIPAMMGEGRWRALVIAAALGVVSVPFLPWGEFLSRFSAIQAVYDQQTPDALPWTMTVLLAVAVISLGRVGLLLATPALWPTPQPHYGIFSLAIIGRSRLLAAAFAIPGAAPWGILLYASIAAARRQTHRIGPATALNRVLGRIGSERHGLSDR